MHEICVIGCGRVGLPLALSLKEKGLDIVGADINEEMIQKVNSGIMPFKEPGYEDLVKTFKIINIEKENYPKAEAYIITVGTPLREHIETDLSQVTAVINTLISKIDIKDKLIILRSTVAPNTTNYIKEYIERKTGYSLGEDFYLSMCPERLAEGKAYEELLELPQIIGSYDNISFEKANKIFSKFGVSILKSSPEEAELAKLFCNIYRYIDFSISNYFMYICKKFKIDIHTLLNLAKKDYPRMAGLKSPGFTAMTCLRKDFGAVNEFFPQTDIILQAYKINEFVPKMLVDAIEDEIKDKVVGILGYTGKKDVDDTRDSLSPKLIRYIKKQLPLKILIGEPNLPYSYYEDKFNNYSFNNEHFEQVIKKSKILFIATNHSEFYKINKDLFEGKIVIDVWNILQKRLVNYL